MKPSVARLFVLFSLFSLDAHGAFEVVAPRPGALVPVGRLGLDIRGCEDPRLKVSLDGSSQALFWSRLPYATRFVGDLAIPAAGKHVLRIQGACGKQPVDASVEFESSKTAEKELAMAVARNFARDNSPESLDWNWGPAVFLYAISRLGEEFTPYLSKYHAHHARRPEEPRFADHCPSALSAIELFKRAGDDAGLTSALAVASYLRHEERNAIGSLDHLGSSSSVSWTYPSSIWVDSLMMWGVFSVKWGRFAFDQELLRFGLAQPAIFASKLQDPQSGLFRHAWMIEKQAAVPEAEAFWLRGNGWVVTAIIEMLDALPPSGYARERAELLAIYRRAVQGLLAHQLPNGLWDTIVNDPGYAYEELSGSALAAYAIARGVQRGYLDRSLLPRARQALVAIAARLDKTSVGYSMPGISWYTIPLPKAAYRLVPLRTDLPYGVGAFVLAAQALSESPQAASPRPQGAKR
jgi:unsaturated rhamnogalacturonyl hydrolase